MAATVGGSNECSGGSAVAVNGTADGLFSAVPSEFGAATGGFNDSWAFGYVFPSPVLIAEFRPQARGDFGREVEAPKVFLTQISTDAGATWQSVNIYADETDWAADEIRSILTGGTVMTTGLGRSNARGWRCRTTATGGIGPPMIAELVFAASAGGATICTGGNAIANTGSNFGDRPPRAAFDGDPATRSSGFGDSTGRLGYVRQTPLGDAVEARILISPNAGDIAEAPTAGFFDYSEDLVTWTEVASFSIPSPVVGAEYTFAL
jgi:hypothetical protein